MTPRTPPAPQRLRLATYNVEWFNALFNDDGTLRETDTPAARFNTTCAQQIAALGLVFTALNCDGIMVIEAPDTGSKRNTVAALETFAARFGLRARRAVHGYASGTEQEIAFLYDPDRLDARHDPQGAPSPKSGAYGAPRFDGALRVDLDADGVAEVMRFSKPPLELHVSTAQGEVLRLMGVHAKSKAAHGSLSDTDFARVAIDNRRKQLAECLWIRARTEGHLAAADSLIVLGDFNDGPGLDEYEALFGQSGIEIALGLTSATALQLHDPHAALALSRKLGLAPTTARFWLATENRYYEALIDFIMVSANLKARLPKWRIWHPLNDPDIFADPALQHALLTASDHFPVTLDLPLQG